MQNIAITDLPSHAQPVLVEFEGLRLPVHYRKGSSPNLVVVFHGAVDQAKRPLPFFQPHFSVASGAHQISISDPTLARSTELKAAWYAGAHDLPLQQVLPRFFARLSQLLQVKRTIYFGASAGGFAALFYSHAHPGSLALVANPQINLLNYLEGPITSYREHCWPRAIDATALASQLCVNVAELYAQSVPNFVCLLNAAGDRYHLYNQTLDLAKGLKPDARNRVILHSEYYGIPGHSGSIPMPACTPWLKAAMYAPNLYADSILTKLHQLRAPAAPPASTPASPAKSAAVDAEDLRLADAVAQWQLTQ
ncbi:hypothetical protein [uncultured Piscinibacter sp.]|uniref:hypothetical protein n=1 Tax=uncultured Piscinibacter sp. TaxID=1131835 RepID=UPI0026200445|nr:hypothetical protein [uncultured Piscinibacter sp.]